MTTEVEKNLPLEELRLTFKRVIATEFIRGINDSGASLDEIDRVLSRERGYSRAWMNSLVDGTTSDLNDVIDIISAAKCDIRFSVIG